MLVSSVSISKAALTAAFERVKVLPVAVVERIFINDVMLALFNDVHLLISSVSASVPEAEQLVSAAQL